jgi:uncharacterized protein (TIGR00255 family)
MKKPTAGLIQSMTGYGQGQALLPSGSKLSLDIKSVNSRHLDLTFKMADDFRTYEALLREHISARVKRGKLECRLTISIDDNSSAKATPATIDEQALVALLNAITRVQNIANADSRNFAAGIGTGTDTSNTAFPLAPVSALDLLRWPGIYAIPQETLPISAEFTSSNTDNTDTHDTTDPDSAAIGAVVNLALDAYTQSRLREGQQTANVMLAYASQMAALVDSLSLQLPSINADLLKKFSDKAIDRISNNPNSEAKLNSEEALARISQELVLLALRADLSEEISRLTSHLAELRNTLAGVGPVGKKLDFLMQEFNREANTLGSKAPSLEVSRVAIDLKLLIEQIREQVQNLE